jgi:hypothetical protein
MPSTMRFVIGWGIAAFIAFALDGFVLGQGGLIFLVAVPLSLAMIVMAAVAATRKQWGVVAARAGVCGLWMFAAVGTTIVVRLHAVMAKSRAEHVIAACREFRKANGRYPDDLSELVPRHLAAVPRARYTVAFSQFDYRKDSHGPSITFVVLPPFMRSTYEFDRDRWITLD